MAGSRSRQFGKPSPWAEGEIAGYEGRGPPRHRVVHPVIKSESSDDSGGGAPLWTPVSGEFPVVTPGPVFAVPVQAVGTNDILQQFAQAEPLSTSTSTSGSDQEEDYTMASSTMTQGFSEGPDFDTPRAPVRHRHTLGSSLSALTAPFVPGIRHKKSYSESLAVANQPQTMNYASDDDDETVTPFFVTPTRSATKSLARTAIATKGAPPPFPFTKRPDIPGLKELLANRPPAPPPPKIGTKTRSNTLTIDVAQKFPFLTPDRAAPEQFQQAHVQRENDIQAVVLHNGGVPQAEHRLRAFATPSEETRRTRSDALNWLTHRGVPDERSLLSPEYLPFVESAKIHSPCDYAVVKFSNIPYGISRTEIANLVGRSSRRIVDSLEGIHIIMTRVDGKTHDAFVEFENLTAAMNAVSKLEGRSSGGGGGAASADNGSARGGNINNRVGDRQVVASLSSQAALMEALFPNARGVRWAGSVPQFPMQSDAEPWKRFKGFMTLEELSMLVKHVEFPQRASFSANCPERPYESYISVLKKFPWNETCYITIHMQHVLYDTALKLLEFLQDRVERGDGALSHRLTPLLVRRFVATCLLCPGFTVLQKDNIMVTAGEDITRDLVDGGRMPPLNMPTRGAEHWRHQYTLCPVAGVPQDVLDFYIAIVREETCSAVRDLPLPDQTQLTARMATTSDYWGFFWLEVGFPPAVDPSQSMYYDDESNNNNNNGPAGGGGGKVSAFDKLSLAEAARLEWSAIDRILRRALRPSPVSIGSSMAVAGMQGQGQGNGGRTLH